MLDISASRRRREAVMEALESVCREGPRTRDVGGSASTREVGDAVVEAVSLSAGR